MDGVKADSTDNLGSAMRLPLRGKLNDREVGPSRPWSKCLSARRLRTAVNCLLINVERLCGLSLGQSIRCRTRKVFGSFLPECGACNPLSRIVVTSICCICPWDIHRRFRRGRPRCLRPRSRIPMVLVGPRSRDQIAAMNESSVPSALIFCRASALDARLSIRIVHHLFLRSAGGVGRACIIKPALIFRRWSASVEKTTIRTRACISRQRTDEQMSMHPCILASTA
ncbi:hypothetical protein KC338_g135 [Hortaea werneckii]|nr:hypothetical protein KC338_g135 [Hortaea werneckii]